MLLFSFIIFFSRAELTDEVENVQYKIGEKCDDLTGGNWAIVNSEDECKIAMKDLEPNAVAGPYILMNLKLRGEKSFLPAGCYVDGGEIMYNFNSEQHRILYETTRTMPSSVCKKMPDTDIENEKEETDKKKKEKDALEVTGQITGIIGDGVGIGADSLSIHENLAARKRRKEEEAAREAERQRHIDEARVAEKRRQWAEAREADRSRQIAEARANERANERRRQFAGGRGEATDSRHSSADSGRHGRHHRR